MTCLIVTLRQPVQISVRRSADYVTRSEPYVPGWVLRGAFAAAWIRRYGVPSTSPKRDEFVRLFEGGVRFGPAFAAEGPSSLAVHKHKYDPAPGCRSKVVDRALVDGPWPECTTCDQEWVPCRGIADSGRLVHRRTSVRVGSDGIAVDANLFARESISACDDQGEARVLTGQIIANDPQHVETLMALGPVRVGGRRTSYGLSELAVTSDGEPHLGGQVRPDGRVVVRLVSPAVFVDDYGRPARVPDAAELATWFDADATLIRQWTRWEHVGGWHAASGLPKPTETVVSAGSTYLVDVADPVNKDTLRRLWTRGVGLRRHEGFGHLWAADASTSA